MLFTSIILFILSSNLSLYVARRIQNHPTRIIDFIHSKFPETTVSISYLSDLMIFSQISFFLLYSTYREITLILLEMSLLYLFRILTMSATVLPPIGHRNKIRIYGMNGTGTEYLFSGHACWACLTCLSLIERNRDIVSVSGLVIYNLVSQSAMIVSRNHYTVDVLLAWMLGALLRY
jgi:hypothetical protein